jgi:hypothetical protein
VSAGLPGIGLGGLFFILSALLAPFRELALTLRGQSSRARWASAGRQFAMALAMLVAIQAALVLVHLVTGTALVGLSLGPLISLAVLALVLGVVTAAALVGGRGRREWVLRRMRWALLGSNQ